MVFWVGTVHKQELLWAHNGTVHLHLRYLFALGFFLSCIQRGVLLFGLYLIVPIWCFWDPFDRVEEVS